MIMEAVDRRWYVAYTWWIIGNALLILLLSLVALLAPGLRDNLQVIGVAPITSVLALLCIVYRLTLYNKHAEVMGLNFATFILSLIQIANVINLLNLTGWSHSWYLIIMFIMLFFSGIVGIYPIIGGGLLVSIYLLVVLPNLGHSSDISHAGLMILISYLLCIASYFTWRGRYIDQESQRVSRLAGMLKSKQQQAEILIQSIADGVIVIDTSGKISLINPSAAKMSEWPVNEAINLDVRSVVKLTQEDGKPLAANDDPFSEVLNQRNNLSRKVSLVGREGRTQIVSLVISPIVIPKSQELVGAVAVIRDISEERKLEQQRADFISTASHEMRTPVAAIEGYLSLALNDKVASIDSRAHEYLEKASTSTQHLGRLFQDLLTSAKAEDGRLTSHPIVVELGEFMKHISNDLRLVAEKKGLSMDFVSNLGSTINATSHNQANDIGPSYYVIVDPDRLREVITNLFDNAVKYTEKGKVTVGITGDDNVVQCFIRDTGPGIPADDLPHLFQKFYRVDNTVTRTIGGTGLGLFICRKIIELYKGRIWAESELGKGSTFYINLPRLTSERAKELKAQEAANLTVKPISNDLAP